jgi:hypothetical protein
MHSGPCVAHTLGFELRRTHLSRGGHAVSLARGRQREVGLCTSARSRQRHRTLGRLQTNASTPCSSGCAVHCPAAIASPASFACPPRATPRKAPCGHRPQGPAWAAAPPCHPSGCLAGQTWRAHYVRIAHTITASSDAGDFGAEITPAHRAGLRGAAAGRGRHSCLPVCSAPASSTDGRSRARSPRPQPSGAPAAAIHGAV